MALQSLLYLSVWGLTSLYVRLNGSSKTIAPTFMKYNNRLYSLASLVLLLLILLSGMNPQYDATARTLFHASKFYEYLDILSVTAAGGSVNLHFGFHHLTTPWLTFVRVLPDSPRSHAGWRWFAAANTAHHALMYAYFGGWAQTQRMREILLWTGEVQLWIGMLTDGWVVSERLVARGEGDDDVWRLMVSAGLLGTYFILNRRELREKEREERRGKED
ncbi:uncharacterized protein B0T15DRAFT_510652 [Chaetomium strumarium]|uniref:Uncharacterized protein n=1 Tax=Chaetomium strumarium TaxID=1170767 RepID=A0AAJ0M366_9PEZI|nr:hypothetical protein B0T15DRAFT_510652 [Chaetomium strumarium]